jgi:hypothetical protein
MSIRCNPGAPKEVPEDMMRQLLAAAPDIVKLEEQVRDSSLQLRHDYGCINRAPTLQQNDHKELRNALKNAKKGFKTEMNDAYRKDYFYQVHNVMMKRQLQRNLDTGDDAVAEDPEPPIEHQLAERMRVQQLLCDLKKDLSPEKIVSRKILAINAQTTLASRQEPQTRKAKPASTFVDPVKKEPQTSTGASLPDSFPQLDEFPLALGKT